MGLFIIALVVALSLFILFRNNSSKANPTKYLTDIDIEYSKSLALLEMKLQEKSDFYGLFLDHDREQLLRHTDNAIPNVILGIIYLKGINAPKDISKAEEFLLKSTHLGCPLGFTYLAVLEFKEKQNMEKGLQYLEQGIKSKDSEAMMLAGYYYAYMTDQVDMPKAIHYWKMAGKHGHELAKETIESARAATA